jgi:asparagine synthase (glutamine-hydrolysing)
MAAQFEGKPRVEIGPWWAIARCGPERKHPGTFTDAAILDTMKPPGLGPLATVDERQRELLLAVDPFGIETIYFHRTSSGVIFSSGLGALLEHDDVRREVDPQAVYHYVYFHVVPGPRGIFRGVERLEPGECAIVREGALVRRRYWKPRYEESARSEDELTEEFRLRVRNAVRASLEGAEGPVGAFLSGGTDSSTIVGVLRELEEEAPRAYSIGFETEGYDESSYARIAAEHFGAEHQKYVVTPDDVLDALPQLARAYHEPFGNASAVASYYCAKLARDDGVSLLLGGDGGDEIFGGNERYRKQAVFERYHRLPRLVRERVLEPLLGPPRENGFVLARKARSYVAQANTPLPDRLESYNFVRRMTPEAIFAPEFLETISVGEPLALIRSSFAEAETSSTLNRLLHLDLKFTLADNDLRKVGTTCAIAGVDVRFPFLDLELVEFANRIPPGLKLKGRKLRYLFKRASEGFLPDAVLKKPKHGFGVPCGRWMRDHPPLRELAHECVNSLVKRGVIRKDFATKLLELHRGEHADYYGVMVYVLTMLELWYREYSGN